MRAGAGGCAHRRDGGGCPCVTRITLIGKPGCHLCDDARVVVERVAAELGVGWEERRPSTTTRRCAAQYCEQIPVTLVDGAPARLLAGRPGPAAGGPGAPGPAHVPTSHMPMTTVACDFVRPFTSA